MGVMREMGYHVGGVALTTTYKAFLYESGVDTFLRRAQKLFGALVQPGEFFVEEVDKGHWRQWTRGWPGLTHAMHAATVGWMVRYLELMGATDVIAHDSLLQENGDPVGHTEIQFTPPVEAAGSEI